MISTIHRMILLIKNMESDRCRAIVIEELQKLGINSKSVELGEVEITRSLSDDKLQDVANALRKSGLELMVSNKLVLIKKIKEAIRKLVYFPDELKRTNISNYLSNEINYDYTYVSKTFSEIEGITIEKYYIRLRIDRVKNLLSEGRHSLSEIACKMLYSSVAHLSNQFKKVTGITPYNYRQLEEFNSERQIELDNL